MRETVCEYCGFGNGAHSQICPHGTEAKIKSLHLEQVMGYPTMAMYEALHAEKAVAEAEVERLRALLTEVRAERWTTDLLTRIDAALGGQVEDEAAVEIMEKEPPADTQEGSKRAQTCARERGR